MFGIGAQEMVIIGLLCLLVFGPGSLSGIARDLGGFVRKARESVDEFKAELDSMHDDSWEDPAEHPEEIWGDEQRELQRAPELAEHGAGDASLPFKGKEGAPEWVTAPGTHSDLEEEPRSEHGAPVYARDADEPAPEPTGA